MKRTQFFAIPALTLIGAMVAPVVASGPVGAAITPTSSVATPTGPSGAERFSVANVPPRVWIAKGLTQLNGDPLTNNFATPYSWYNFEILAEDDNTLWNARIVICFHNTSHAVASPGTAKSANNSNSGVAFTGMSNTLTKSYRDCVLGSTDDQSVDLRDPAAHAGVGGLNDANPNGAVVDTGSTSQGESWRKARWVLKQSADSGLSNGVDPTESDIINLTENNGTWRLGPAIGVDPKPAATPADPDLTGNAPCAHATRTVGGVATKTRYDSTLVHLKCSVRIGTLARATEPLASADWDLTVAVIDGGDATNTVITDDSYMNRATYANQIAVCSAGYDGMYINDTTWPGYESCTTDGYTPPGQFKVATNLSIGSIAGHDFGTLLPPRQQIGVTDQNLGTNFGQTSGTDTNPQTGADYAAGDTVEHCKREQAAGVDAATASPVSGTSNTWFTCAYVSHKVDNLVANTDHWKFQAKTTAAGGDNSPECNTSGDSKIAPALGYSGVSGKPSYTCWYATNNPNYAGNDDTQRDADKTYAVALYEPGGTNDGSAEWDPDTMQANQFAFRCMAFPKDADESTPITREVDFPTQLSATATQANARVYVGKNFADVPLFEYDDGPIHDGASHVINQVAGSDNKPAVNVEKFDGMGSDNSSAEGNRIWRRLDSGAVDYEAYLHCRLDTSYVRAGTYTGIVYLAISSV